jgi:hypothetical protein
LFSGQTCADLAKFYLHMNSPWFCDSGIPPLHSQCCIAVETERNITDNSNTSKICSEEVYSNSYAGRVDITKTNQLLLFAVALVVYFII